MVWGRNEKMMVENAGTVRWSMEAQDGAEKEKERKPLH
jgi:hypothetical protein